MAEPDVRAAADVADGPPVAEERGTLDVRTKVIQHVVERAVLDTPGTVAHHTALGRLRGSNTPRADVTMHGRTCRVAVDVAAVWPCRIAEIATSVRDSVLLEATRLTGVHIRSVDVTIHAVDPDTLDQPERSRVQ